MKVAVFVLVFGMVTSQVWASLPLRPMATECVNILHSNLRLEEAPVPTDVLELGLNEQQTVELAELFDDYGEAIEVLEIGLSRLNEELGVANPLSPGYMDYVSQISYDKASTQQSIDNLIAERLIKTYYILTKDQRQEMSGRRADYDGYAHVNKQNPTKVSTPCSSVEL